MCVTLGQSSCSSCRTLELRLQPLGHLVPELDHCWVTCQHPKNVNPQAKKRSEYSVSRSIP